MGVFSKNNTIETDIKRNPFDLSFQNNLTMKMGYIYPCFCKEVVSGDSLRIQPAFGLRFMPTAFPLQTKIKAHLDFFYVRNRNLWDKWQNYFTQVGPHDGFPVLSDAEALRQSRTSSLGDYLGLPSTLVGSIYTNVCKLVFLQKYDNSTAYGNTPYAVDFVISSVSTSNDYYKSTYPIISLVNSDKVTDFTNFIPYSFDVNTVDKYVSSDITYVKLILEGVEYSNIGKYFNPSDQDVLISTSFHTSNHSVVCKRVTNWSSDIAFTVINDKWCFLINVELLKSTTGEYYNDKILISLVNKAKTGNNYPSFNVTDIKNVTVNSYSLLTEFPNAELIGNISTESQIYEATDILQDVPYKISALPFRAYEQIYNSFYRDDRNNPFTVNGVFDPNVFITNNKGGVDSTQYKLFKRNWEQDFLTTALPSPQFGEAPLVGLTSSGVASFANEDGTITTSQLETDSDGDTVIGFSTTDNTNVNRQLIKLASSGISINDLRGVNALQRYLETKYRRGLRYRDQIINHFGVTISQDILDMPEFIGGVTQMIDTTQINQTSAGTDENPLGSFAGQLSCVGGAKSIQKYCDEPGYIIGLISIVPVPSYSQLVPKHFLKTNEALDFYFPEFAHLGFQPIKYKEVCPLQATTNNVDVEETFGYQRAWYDYLSSVDEIHGDFRKSMNDFVLARVFNSVPSLNEEFLTVDPQSLNDVFTVNEINGQPIDTILGQIHFDVTAMRPIPRFGVPKLE